MGRIEALYIFDEHNDQLLDHVYTGRPATAAQLIQQYLLHPHPRPSLIYLPNARPPTCLFSLIHNGILFLCPTTGEIEPLLVLEFLHRVADALEHFIGAPLLSSKFEANYDVIVQIVGDMCDAGLVCNTEPDALREVVETSSWMGSLLGGFGLPASTPSLAARSASSSLQPSSSLTSLSNNTSAAGSAIPWRRANVRHTSNELYVDIVEKLSVIVAPSGRPLTAFANGTIAFNSKLSGVPDLVLNLIGPGGKNGIQRAMELPCFHQCVRLARWRDKPGELSFVPPDGKFILASYECDLLPDTFHNGSGSGSGSGKMATPQLNLPVFLELSPSVGDNGDELEVRLSVTAKPGGASSGLGSDFASNRVFDSASKLGRTGSAFASLQSSAGTSASPATEEVTVSIPTRASVRNVLDIRASVGEAHHLPGDGVIEWRISGRQIGNIGRGGALLRCTIVGETQGAVGEDAALNGRLLGASDAYEYDENGEAGSYQSTSGTEKEKEKAQVDRDARCQWQSASSQSASLMPQSALLSFRVKGWLASGIKVESLTVNTKTSKGLGAGVTPYKGVKYHTVSQQGIEVRC